MSDEIDLLAALGRSIERAKQQRREGALRPQPNPGPEAMSPGEEDDTDDLREQGWDVTRREAVGFHGKYSVVLDRAKGVATCMNGDPHSEHDWWYTDENGGHMIEERNAGPDDRKWHCPGVTRRAES